MPDMRLSLIAFLLGALGVSIYYSCNAYTEIDRLEQGVAEAIEIRRAAEPRDHYFCIEPQRVGGVEVIDLRDTVGAAWKSCEVRVRCK